MLSLATESINDLHVIDAISQIIMASRLTLLHTLNTHYAFQFVLDAPL